MKTKLKILFKIFLAASIVFSLVGCSFEKPREFQVESFQIGEDTYVEAVKVDMNGNELTDKEIDILARKLFKQASIVCLYRFFASDYMELDYSNSIQAKRPIETFPNVDDTIYKWYKVKYINTWEELKTIYESIYTKEYCEKVILSGFKYFMKESEGRLYQSNDLVVTGSGRFSVIPTSKKIKVLYQSADVIKVRACIKGGVRREEDNTDIDGDLDFTISNENGHWVLSDYYGKTPQS